VGAARPGRASEPEWVPEPVPSRARRGCVKRGVDPNPVAAAGDRSEPLGAGATSGTDGAVVCVLGSSSAARRRRVVGDNRERPGGAENAPGPATGG
jgi:hypothetical protein